MIFVISTINESINNIESFYWGEKYLPSIKKFFPSNFTEVNSITKGIILFNKADQKDKYALRFKITSIDFTNAYLKISVHINDKLNYTSYQIKNALKQYFKLNSIFELPFCSTVDEDKLFEIIVKTELTSEIELLERNNNWVEIYKLLEKYFPLENSELWNNHEVLNKFAFATAKLSECSENLKRKFPNKEQRNEFIKKKRYYRELTIKLRNRCIELAPDNAAYYSNLAYSYYQSVNELNTPNGRRDGNILLEADLALKLLNKALKIDNTRLNDKFRKALLLSEILPNYILYKPKHSEKLDNSETEQNYISPIEMIEEGTNELIELVKIFDTLSDKNSNDYRSEKIHHYKKYYIKALYHIAQNQIRLTKIDFNLFNLIYGKKVIQIKSEEADKKIKLLYRANDFINICIQKDYNKRREEKHLIDLVDCNNYISAVYKAYLKAVIETYLYILTEKIEHMNTAKEFYHKALELNFPEHQARQNKIFILEKVAILNLIEGKYEAAIKTIEPLYTYSNKNSKLFPPYAAVTLAISYILKRDKSKAQDIISDYINCGNKIFERKFQKLMEIISTNK